MTAATCDEMEVLLAAQAGVEGQTLPAELLEHLVGCGDCLRLARELENPVVADALDEASASGVDLVELTVVPTENYVRGKEIGRGGMGRIVRARDRRLGRSVAIKELLDERMRSRFEREARLTARLQHPAIVSVHEAGRWPSGEPFYAMKYVAGRPLNRLIDEKTGAADRLSLLPHVITVVEAIAYAHSERVIHRDLKPHNILVGPFGETVVIDWGLAKDLAAPDANEPAAPYRADGATVGGAGTPAYMPPEQVRGETPDERVDVYALGATLYHVITGAPPPSAPGVPQPVLTVAPATPPELAAIVDKAMAPAASERFRTASELAADLRRFQSGQLVGAHRYTVGQLAGRWARRHRAALVAAALFVASLGIVGGVSLARVVAAKREATAERDRARHSYAQALAERGRQESLSGSPARALPYLASALDGGADSPQLRFLLGEASRTTSPLLLSLEDKAFTAALDPNGTTLATATPDQVHIIDVATGKVRATADVHTTWLAFDATGRRLLLTTFNGKTVELRDPADLHPLAALVHDETVQGARLSPDGGRVLTWAGKAVTVWTSDGKKLFTTAPASYLQSGVFDPTGARVLVGDREGKAFVLDAASGATLLELTGHTGGAFDPTGATIATGSWDQHVHVFDAAGKPLRELELGESVRQVAYTPDGELIVAAGLHLVKAWRVATGETVLELSGGGHVQNGVSLVGDGTRLLVVSRDDVALYDLFGRLRQRFEGHAAIIINGAASADGARVVTVGLEERVNVWQTGGRADPAPMLPADRAVFSSDGRLLLVGPYSADVYDHDRRLVASLPFDDIRPPRFMGWNDKGVWMEDLGEKRTWDPSSGAVVVDPTDKALRVTRAMSPNGMLSVSWSMMTKGAALTVEDKTRRVKEMVIAQIGADVAFSDDGKTLAYIRGNRVSTVGVEGGPKGMSVMTQEDIHFVAFSPDGRRILAASYGNEVTIWDIATGTLVQTLRGRTDQVATASFTADGAMVLTGGSDGTATLWDVEEGVELASWSLAGGAVIVAAIDPSSPQALLSTRTTARMIDLSPDAREVAEVSAAVARQSPYRLVDGRIVGKPIPAGVRVGPVAPRPAPTGIVCPPATTRTGDDSQLWCSLSSGAPSGLRVTFWPGGGRKEETLPGKRPEDLRIVRHDTAGRTVQTIELEGRHGTFTRYHENGMVADRMTYSGGATVGEYIARYPSGVVRERGRFQDCPDSDGCTLQPPVGLWTTYHEDGRKESEGMYLTRHSGGLPLFGGPDFKVGLWTYFDRSGATRTEIVNCLPQVSPYIAKMNPRPVCVSP